MKNYTKQAVCMLSLLLLVPGCGIFRKKDDNRDKSHKSKKKMAHEVDVPVASDAVKGFFDEEEVQDFLLDEDDVLIEETAQHDAQYDSDDIMQQVDTTGDIAQDTTEFAWAQDQEKEDESFRVVLFDFDGSRIKEDQEAVIDYNAEIAKKKIADAKDDHQVSIVIDGHACHSAGTPAYNLVISERRARAVRNRLIAKGIAEENIKIVGRGDEVPAVVDGKKVTGNRQEQWQNRRGELHVIYS